MDTITELNKIAQQVVGLKYGSKRAEKILDFNNPDWSGVWPVVGIGRVYTGDIVESENDYVNLDDMAMVHKSDLKTGDYYTGYCKITDVKMK